MTDPTPDLPIPEDTALAAELALGLLEAEERAAAQARLAADPAFAAQVRDWQEMLAGMAEGLTPVMVPQRAKRALDQRLGLTAPSALDLTPVARRGWGRWIGALAAAMVLAALVLIALPMLRPGSDPAARDYAAVMSEGAMKVEARMIAADHVMEVRMTGATVPAGRDYELWWIGPDAAPVSLGVLPREGGAGRMEMPAGLAPAPGVLLAITDEPAGGAPGGVPTGARLADAPLTIL